MVPAPPLKIEILHFCVWINFFPTNPFQYLYSRVVLAFVYHGNVFRRLVVKVEVWLFSGKVWGPLPSGRHCIVCNSIYQINLFEKQNWIKPSFTTNVRQKLKALMQGLQQRGQEYTGSGTMRGHNNVGVDEMPMQFNSNWYLHIYNLEIFIFEDRCGSVKNISKNHNMVYPIQFSVVYLVCPRVPFFAVVR